MSTKRLTFKHLGWLLVELLVLLAIYLLAAKWPCGWPGRSLAG